MATRTEVSIDSLNSAGFGEKTTHLLSPHWVCGMRSGSLVVQIHHRWPMAEFAATKRQVPQPPKGVGCTPRTSLIRKARAVIC